MGDFWTELPGGVATELISNLVWIVLAAATVWVFFLIRKRLLWWFVGATRKLLVVSAIVATACWVVAYFGYMTPLNAALAFAGLLSATSTYLLYRFYRLGILDVFIRTARGIDYRASLKRPRHSFDFLGVGAHKLTSIPEFRQMIVRCAKAGRPVRLLLSPPDNPVLRNVASRTGIDRNTYASRVRESLKTVADLAIKEGFNIEVKFYHAESEADFQQFRLVFIDDRICVMSYTIWDDQEGRSNPQVVLTAGQNERSPHSLYYTFKDYFERMWTDPKTSAVDLTRYR